MNNRSMRSNRWIVSGSLALLGVVAACSTSEAPTPPSSPNQSTTVMTKVQAESLGTVLAADADAMIEGTSFNVTGNFGLASPAPVSGCNLTPSPMPIVNSDSDFVPDSERIDFTGCGFATRRGTVTLAGTIDFIDPTPTTTDHAVKTVFTGLTQTATDSAGDTLRRFTEDGSRELVGTSSVFQFTETNFLTTWKSGDRSATHLKNWSAMFTADTAGTITSFRLPNGTWDLSGTSTYTRTDSAGSDTLSITVSTNPGLHFNRACTEWPRFDAGTLTAVATKNGATATVTVAFTACGQFTVTKS